MQERQRRQQQRSKAEALAGEAAAAKGEVAALRALKKTLAEQVLSHEAQVTCCTRLSVKQQISPCATVYGYLPLDASVLACILAVQLHVLSRPKQTGCVSS